MSLSVGESFLLKEFIKLLALEGISMIKIRSATEGLLPIVDKSSKEQLLQMISDSQREVAESKFPDEETSG